MAIGFLMMRCSVAIAMLGFDSRFGGLNTRLSVHSSASTHKCADDIDTRHKTRRAKPYETERIKKYQAPVRERLAKEPEAAEVAYRDIAEWHEIIGGISREEILDLAALWRQTACDQARIAIS